MATLPPSRTSPWLNNSLRTRSEVTSHHTPGPSRAPNLASTAVIPETHQCSFEKPCNKKLKVDSSKLPEELRHVAQHDTKSRLMTHSEMLSHPGFSISTLRELQIHTHLSWRCGLYTSEEAETMDSYLDEYCKEHQMKKSRWLKQLKRCKSSKRLHQYNSFWKGLARAVTRRPLIHLLEHFERCYLRLPRRGKWTDDEDNVLRAAVAEHGTEDWKRISDLVVSRTKDSCCSRYHNFLKPSEGEVTRTGKWTDYETQLLEKRMRLACRTAGKWTNSGRFDWQFIAKGIEGRTPLQCANKA